MTQPTTCLILGATGFIGGQIARAAIARGWQVSGVRRSPDAVGDLAGLPVRWLQADLDDPASLRIAIREWRSSVVSRPSSVLFHCAGAYPHNAKTMSRDVEAARRQMRNVLDIAAEAGVGRLVYTSSFTTIGAPAEPARARGAWPTSATSTSPAARTIRTTRQSGRWRSRR